LVGTQDNATFFVGHLHHGHWQKVKTPKLGGRYGSLTTIAAGSAGSVWLGGAIQLKAGSLVTVPAIWRLKGGKFVAQKLPALSNLSSAVSSISASSATNAWAVGGLYPGATAAQVAFRWNGKKWSAVTVPSGYSQGLYDVSVSGPTNAWALRSDYLASQDTFVHWNGKAWTVGEPAPTGVTLESGVHTSLAAVSMHGKSAWAVGGGAKPVLLHSTGGAWKVGNTPGKSYQLVAVSAATVSRAYAVGSFVIPESANPVKTFFDLFSGHSWKGEVSAF
jgi:hypothetical protein